METARRVRGKIKKKLRAISKLCIDKNPRFGSFLENVGFPKNRHLASNRNRFSEKTGNFIGNIFVQNYTDF